MKVLFIGDVVSSVGRKAVQRFLSGLSSSKEYAFIIANGENASGGRGLDEKSARDLFDAGIDLLTGGNHSWDKRDALSFLSSERRILRPANYPEHAGISIPGRGMIVLESRHNPGQRLGVFNLMGRVHMDPLDDPFQVADKCVEWFESLNVKCTLLDFHAEATSEKAALAHYLIGRVSAVVGTHTHVQTADERILIQPSRTHTAFITDVGMTGPYHSVIGMRVERSIERFRSKMPTRYESADGVAIFNAVSIELNPRDGSALTIQRVSKVIDENGPK